MSDRSLETIAIVGAGFSGTATAIHLLRQARGRKFRVLLIERGVDFGRGLAYAKCSFPYVLNVPASRMSATASDPNEFLRFAQRNNDEISGEDFLPRALYGDYLQHLLATAAAAASSGVFLERLRAEVVDVTAGVDQATLRLADGSAVNVDAVVLAVGTPLPRLPASIRCTAEWPAVRKDPWAQSGLDSHRGPLLVIGTSLTMVDVVCAAAERSPTVEIHAISRHGLIPPSQSQFWPHALTDDAGLLARAAGSIGRLLAAVRSLSKHVEGSGGDWREVVSLVRLEAPGLWRSLPLAERARFLRHARAYWDIHRHRIPAAVRARLDGLRETRRLSVHAGRLLSLETTADGVLATWLARHSVQRRTLHAQEVVICTGPDYDVTRAPDPLWQALLARGLTVPDPLRLGVRTARNGALVGQDGSTSQRLFYVGPLLRADHWEATAVGELRMHAQHLAEYLLEHRDQVTGTGWNSTKTV